MFVSNNPKTDVNSARDLESVKAILHEMEVNNKDLLTVDRSLRAELKSYLRTGRILRSEVVATDPE